MYKLDGQACQYKSEDWGEHSNGFWKVTTSKNCWVRMVCREGGQMGQTGEITAKYHTNSIIRFSTTQHELHAPQPFPANQLRRYLPKDKYVYCGSSKPSPVLKWEKCIIWFDKEMWFLIQVFYNTGSTGQSSLCYRSPVINKYRTCSLKLLKFYCSALETWK